MTEEQSEKYIAEGGTHCPHCGNQDIEGKGFNADAGTASQEMFCGDCGNGWTDVYTLTHIEPD